jgi:hypothetical protein
MGTGPIYQSALFDLAVSPNENKDRNSNSHRMKVQWQVRAFRKNRK